ncbi:hypothetical protein H8D57_00315, partial [bacterium]|nr:hypothetical protein [bacterium]
MKASTMFLTVLSVLIICNPLQSQNHIVDGIENFDFENNNPNRDEPYETPQGNDYELLEFDFEELAFTEDQANIFSRVSFTPIREFTLYVIAIMPYNPGPNESDPCYVYIYREDAEHNLEDRPVWATRINSLEAWDERDFGENWIELNIPGNNGISFEAEENFSIIYGPAPGGDADGGGDIGGIRNDEEGWWNLYVRDDQRRSSFISTQIVSEHQTWQEGEFRGDLLITAGGELISDNNAPEWAELPHNLRTEEGEVIEFEVIGRDADGDDLRIAFNSDDFPDAVVFSDRGEGRGVFSWETGFSDAGNYTAVFVLSDGEDEVSAEIRITITDVNQAPEWSEMQSDFQVDEGESLEIDLFGRDFDGDDLSIDFSSENLPREAEFRDYGEGRGVLNWRPTFEDEGDYSAQFTLSDRHLEDVFEVRISVANINRTPVWIEFPEEQQVTGYIDEAIEFQLTAEDPEGDDIRIEWHYSQEPPSEPEIETTIDGGRIGFTMHPDRFQAGSYQILFTASDGESETEIEIDVSVLRDHFRDTPTNRKHTIRINALRYFGNNWTPGNPPDDEDVQYDQIAILTPAGIVAGVFEFNNLQANVIDGEPIWSMYAWGDLPNTQPVEGFRHHETTSFLFWDFEEDVEYDANVTINAGDQTWRWNGYTEISLSIGPDLITDPEAIYFGVVRTGQTSIRELALSSIGSLPAENLEFDIEDGFSFEGDLPEDIAVGQDVTVRIAFSPEQVGQYAGVFSITNEYLSVSIDLRGYGLEMDHFEHTPTQLIHRVSVVNASLNGERLEE